MYMKNKLNYIAVLFSVFIFSWVIPFLYEFVTRKAETTQLVIYSSVAKDFLTQEMVKEDSFVYKDRKGNTFSQYQMDSLVPSIGYRILMLQNRMPDTILGRRISSKEFIEHNFFFSHSPEDINNNSPKLYLLMESEPKRIELSLPNDVFRLTDNSIEFVDLKTNRLIKQKSDLYTEAMKKAGIIFPIKTIGGNPTPMKQYDNGYILADKDNNLFQMKMLNGNPLINRISNKANGMIRAVFVTEYPDKRFIAFVSDSNNKLYAINAATNRLHMVGIPSFDPEKDNLIILGNVFDWNIEVNRNGNRTVYAVNNDDLSLLDSVKIDTKTSFWQYADRYIFPIKTSFTDKNDKYFYPRIDISNIKYSIFTNIILLIIFIIYQYKRNNICFPYFTSVLIVIFGVFGILAYIYLLNSKDI